MPSKGITRYLWQQMIRKKTTFVTPVGNYHYKVMSFGLKNAWSIYQRMMTKMFEPQLGKNVKVYIDDMVVKSKVVSEHLGNLTNFFEILRRHKLRLNALLERDQESSWVTW